MSDGEMQDENHLKDLDDGAGCTEIWEALSEEREANAPQQTDAK